MWYAICAEPQREFACEIILTRMGFTAFVPIEVRKMRRHRHCKSKDQIKFPMVRGYVFVQLNGYDVASLNRLCQLSFVRGIVGHKGAPKGISDEQMVSLQRISANAPSNAYVKTYRPLRRGDKAEVISGAFTGHIVEITSVKGQAAMFIASMFGGEREVAIRLDQLEAA